MRFIKRDANKLKRVGTAWRKPRGRKNKTKVGKKGHRPMPSKGFRSRLSTRYTIAGKIPVRVHNAAQVEKLNDGNVIIIAGTVGYLKRAKILETCKSKNLMVINHERNVENAETAGK